MSPIDVICESEATLPAQQFAQAERGFPEQLHATRRNFAHRRYPFVADLAVHQETVDCVRCLVGDDIAPSSSVPFIKEARTRLKKSELNQLVTTVRPPGQSFILRPTRRARTHRTLAEP